MAKLFSKTPVFSALTKMLGEKVNGAEIVQLGTRSLSIHTTDSHVLSVKGGCANCVKIFYYQSVSMIYYDGDGYKIYRIKKGPSFEPEWHNNPFQDKREVDSFVRADELLRAFVEFAKFIDLEISPFKKEDVDTICESNGDDLDSLLDIDEINNIAIGVASATIRDA